MSARRRRTLQQRVDERRPILESLVGDFSRYVQRFNPNQQFGGPSVYDAFFEYLYATLASWGLHRMGRGKAKLGDLGELKASFREQASNIERVQQLRIDQLDPSSVPDVAEQAWAIMAGLRVGIGQTLLVANSKALHHLLPGLIPPIDRTYTLNFFVGRTYVYRGRDADYFRTLYPLFQEIAVRCSGAIHGFIAAPPAGMNTSVTKVIDNAILGFMPTQPSDP